MNRSLRNCFLLSITLFALVTFHIADTAPPQLPAISEDANFDGPAELPREQVKSSLQDTPATGKHWTVRVGQSLDEALNHASCGDVVELQAGGTFSGTFEIPKKNCDDAHWIIIRTSAPDSSLPAPNARVTPCYAGVAELPGRPQLNCSSTEKVLAKIELNHKSGSGPIVFAPGANHYRLIGLEVTRASFPGCIYNLIEFKGQSDHVVFDRMWIHGNPQDETVRGILLGTTRHVAVINSFFSDFHCIARTGSCSDAQAVAGGIGAGPMGPYKISGNFLEASGENVLFGGGAATATPTDIEVSHNYMFKPLTWMKGQPGYVGGSNGNPFIVKNLFELKNAQRVLLDGNVMENSWGGFSQVGFAILLTPKNPGASSCPVCQVTDITIRYNLISHVAAGLQIANVLSDSGAAALDGQRYSIHDIIVDDIDGSKYNGPGEFAQILAEARAPAIQNVTINHVTAFPPHTLLLVGNKGHSPIQNFVFTNNIVTSGTHPVWSTGGGPANCAYPNKPLATLDACFSKYSFKKNIVIGVPPSYPPSVWPSENYFLPNAKDIKFVNHNGGSGGDYHLQPSSRYKHAATDGKDAGADIDAIASATTSM